ncbi:hypothetical protein FB451DRAFT_956255, partial [Mycena latifolia]
VPALPPELERKIFEICALGRPVSIPKLMLVALRVKEWVEPLLYRTITLNAVEPSVDGYPNFTSSILRRAIRRKSATFFQIAVRNLHFFEDCEDDLVMILSICTGVENLSLGMLEDDPVIPCLELLRLKRLCADVGPSLRYFSATHPLFSQITHLELLDVANTDTALYSQLSLLPNLTHLSFNHGVFIPISSFLLKTCRSL